jgi:hypothetical protein
VCYIGHVARHDQSVDRALELGERNAAAIELVRKHCANARVEHDPMGGISMVEQMTGVPISMRTIKCEYAPKGAGFSAIELLNVAVSFYNNNCVGCPHRIPVGVPNLKTVAEQITKDEEEAARRRDRETERQREEQSARHRERERRVVNEPVPARDIVRLINQLDGEEGSARVGEELVAAVRGGKRYLTRPTIDVLVDAARAGFDEHVLEAVRVAAEQGAITPDEALAVAAAALAREPLVEAARTIVRFRIGVSAELLRPAQSSLIRMVGRSFGPSFTLGPNGGAAERRREWLAAFELLIDIDLAGALAAIDAMLAGEDDHVRMRAAAAAEVLVELRPEVAPVMARQLGDALKLANLSGPYAGEERSDAAIGAALTACLRQAPDETSAAMEADAGGLDEERRQVLFRVYDRVVRRRAHDERLRDDIGLVVVDMSLKHTSGDWGPDVKRAAFDLLELISRWESRLLDDRAETLISLLLEAITNRPPRTSPIVPANDALRMLEAMHETTLRNARIREIRETIGGVARRRPREVLDLLMPFLAQDDLGDDDRREMRGECTHLLGFVGKRSEFLPEVLPLLYAGLVSSDQLIRACAIEGLIEIAEAHPQDAIPPEFSATVPALLSDPYVIVHRTMLRALTRGVGVRDEHASDVLAVLLPLADHYAKTETDSDALDDALRGVQIVARRLPDPGYTLAIERLVAKMARRLDDYALEHYLERGPYQGLLDLPEYTEALVDALQRPQIFTEPNSGDARLREILDSVPPRLPQASELVEAARANLDWNVYGALEYVEALQRLGLWAEAVDLADEIAAAQPTTIDHAQERTYAELVRALARVEAAIAEGRSASEIESLLDAAAAASEVYEQAANAAKAELPWPV